MDKHHLAQSTINERLKFLIESLNMSARAFSAAIGTGDTNTRNYLDRGSKPGADYLEKILRRFETVNSAWLLTGKGEPFLPNSDEVAEPSIAHTKNNYGNNVGLNKGTNTQHQEKPHLFISHAADDTARLQELVEQLRSQLADKERTIQILLAQQSKS